MTRVGAIVALVAATVVVALTLVGGGGQRLVLRLENASQLVKGNLIKVGGLPVGTVRSIELADDATAAVEIKVDEEDLLPLRQGTRAWVRVASLSGVASRYIALEPGPNDAPALADGAVLDAADTRTAIDLDAVLSTLDADTRSHLQRLTRGGAEVYAGKGDHLNRGLVALNPAVAQLERTLGEVARDRAAFERFIVATSSWVQAVADRRDDLRSGLASTASVVTALAGERAALEDLLDRAPPTLRQATATLGGVTAALDALRPTARAARPVAPRLTRLVDDLDPVLATLPGAARAVRPALDPLRVWLSRMPALERVARPAFRAAGGAIGAALPIVRGAREYWPDVVLGATNGFGGSAAGPYDANGAYARINFQGGLFSAAGAASQLVPLPEGGFEPGNVMRCAGAATQVAPDGSNTGVNRTVPCLEGQRP